MMNGFLLTQLALLSLGSFSCLRIKNVRQARRMAIACMSAVVILSLLKNFIWPTSSENALIMMATALIGLTVVALSPLLNLKPIIFTHMLMLCGFSLLFFQASHPLALVFLWAIPALIVWSGLRQSKGTRPISRLFAIYHVPSCLFFLMGILLFRLELDDLATWFIIGAILIREGIFPLQTWFTAMVEKAPMGIVVMFVEPQMGIYALHKLVPTAQFASVIDIILPAFAITAIICAGLALAQTKARRSLAYLMLSQSSLVAFGFEQFSHVSQAGSLLTWQVIGIATGGFAMTLMALGARKESLSLVTPSGSFSQTPKMATAFLVLGFASVGLPGTLGFIAEDLLVQGSVENFPVMGFFLIIATAMNGIAVMRMFFYLFCGQKIHAHEEDLIRRESAVLSFVVGLLFLLGFAPRLVLGLIA